MATLNAAEGSPNLSTQVVTRLVEQFNCLAEVTEQLTYRLLNLEERLALQHRLIMALREESMAAGHGLPWQGRLDETDLRLAQIETLLGGKGFLPSLPGQSSRPGIETSPVSAGLAGAGLAGLGPSEDCNDSVAANIFPEESEQRFMDDDLEMPVAG